MQGKKISCPTCRARTKVTDVAYVDSGRGQADGEGEDGQASSNVAQEAAIPVEGSYGTKVNIWWYADSMLGGHASDAQVLNRIALMILLRTPDFEPIVDTHLVDCRKDSFHVPSFEPCLMLLVLAYPSWRWRVLSITPYMRLNAAAGCLIVTTIYAETLTTYVCYSHAGTPCALKWLLMQSRVDVQ